MCESCSGQAGALSQPKVEVTPAMVDAGLRELSVWLDDYVPASWYLLNERAVTEVFLKMARNFEKFDRRWT